MGSNVPKSVLEIAKTIVFPTAMRYQTELAHDHEAPLHEEARFFCDVVVPATLAVRHAGDELEAMVADDLWPLASYQEMLFIL
jgi:glutamine synthetase type III